MAMNGHCTILWSTQSGRAKACARRVTRLVKERSTLSVDYHSTFDELGWAGLQSQRSRVWILLVSTTGDGEHCDSIKDTWKNLLNKSLPKELFSEVRFALFCLGDRAYGAQFCAAGRKLAARLVQLGAIPCCEVGYGDDGANGGVFGDFDRWLDESLLKTLPMKEEVEVLKTISNYSIEVLPVVGHQMNPEQFDDFRSGACPLTAYSYRGGTRIDITTQSTKVPRTGRVVSNIRITEESWQQDTRHISIQLINEPNETAPFLAGDVLSVFPSNSVENVMKFLRVLPKSIQSMADFTIKINGESQSGAVPWPRQCTLRGILTHCADIQAFPEREDLRSLSYFCSDKEQSSKLLSLSETTGAPLYNEYIVREKRTWADVLHDFDSIKITVDHLLMLLSPMRPRQFSIASAPSSILDLCVAVVEGKTPLGRSYQGLCSTFLRELSVGDQVNMWISPGSFGRLPLIKAPNVKQFETPILCIGAGTGIAPLRGLIQERERVRRLMNVDTDDDIDESAHGGAPDNILVFGSRKESMDFYYKDEWSSMAENNNLKLYTAFSQDNRLKIYVQQVIRDAQGGNFITSHILENNGAVFIAGGAKMVRAVKDEIFECLAKALGDAGEAQSFLKMMQRQGKFAVEAWS